LLRDFYASMIKPMASWMADYTDETTGLPRPSYDLWEEKFLITTFTTATTYAALQGAADMADAMEDKDSAVAWRAAADDIHESAQKYLYNDRRKCFYKGLIVKNGRIEYDETIDAS